MQATSEKNGFGHHYYLVTTVTMMALLVVAVPHP